MSASITVVKVGGSLYDLPDLGVRLSRWLVENSASNRVVLVPGGGSVVDAICHLDRCHGLGEETSHWLALRALTVNAHFLAALLPQSSVHGDGVELHRAWNNNQLPILDAHEFALRDEARPGRLPHCWTVTSDALAARVAVVLRASRLVLLKSTTIPEDMDWTETARRGEVDDVLPEILREEPELHVRTVNLRRP